MDVCEYTANVITVIIHAPVCMRQRLKLPRTIETRRSEEVEDRLRALTRHKCADHRKHANAAAITPNAASAPSVTLSS